jgi:hypothetical protein
MMTDVFRRKVPGFSPQLWPGYAFHGATAILALFLLMKAVGL